MKVEICSSTEAPQDEGPSAQEVSDGEESSDGANPDPIQHSVKTEQGPLSPPGQIAAAGGSESSSEVRGQDDPGNLEEARLIEIMPRQETLQPTPIQQEQAAHVGTVPTGVGTEGARANASLPSRPHDRPPPVPTDLQDSNIPLLCVRDDRGLMMFPTHQQLRQAHQGGLSHPVQVAAAGGSGSSVEGRREEDPGARRGVGSIGNFPRQETFQPTPMQREQAARAAVPPQGGRARANVYPRSHPYERRPRGPMHLQDFNGAVLGARDGPLVWAQPSQQQDASSQNLGHFARTFRRRAINTGPGLLGDPPQSSPNPPFFAGRFRHMGPTGPAPTPPAMIASPPSMPQQFLGSPVFPGMPSLAGPSMYGPGILPEWIPPAPPSPNFVELLMALNWLNDMLLGPQISAQAPAPLPTQQLSPPFLAPDLFLPVPVFQPGLPPLVFEPQQPLFPPNFGGYGPPSFPSPRQ